MTALAGRAAQGAPATVVRRRLAALLRTELRLLARFGAFAATAVITTLWVVVLRFVPADARTAVTALVLLTDVTALGFLFVPALLVLERVEGVTVALRMTPVRTAERVAVRIGLTTALSLVAGGVIAVAGGVPHVPVALVGVATTSVLTGLIAFAAVGASSTLTTFLLRAPLVAAPLLAPALVHATGLADSALLHLSPVTSAVDLLRGEMSWTGLAWQLVWIAGAAVLVGRSARRPWAAAGTVADRAPTGAPEARWLPHPGRYAPLAAVRSLARADRRGVVRDGLLVLLLGSVPLLAVAGRVVGTAGVTWAQQRHGLDLRTYLPVVWVVLLVVHTPVILGSLTGLLLLEDRDAGLLPAIATTRASVRTLLTYRLAATAGATAIGLAIGLPLAGARHAAGGIGVAAVAVGAGALSAVPAMLMAAFATNRVQGVAVMKILGLPLYLPVASFFVAGPLRWAFAPLPSAWPMWTLWAATPAAAVTFAAVGVAVSTAVTALLARRVLRRVTWV